MPLIATRFGKKNFPFKLNCYIIAPSIKQATPILHSSFKTQMAEQLPGERMSGFSLVDEKIVKNILSRLPALTFANAACVNKGWYKICNQILNRPKLASALSLNPSLHVSCFSFILFFTFLF